MKRTGFHLLALVTVFVACADDPGATTGVPGAPTLAPGQAELAPLHTVSPDQRVPGRYIVRLRDDVDDPEALAREIAATVGGTVRHVYLAALKGFAIDLSSERLTDLRSQDELQYVTEDARGRVTSTQVNPPWNLDRIDQQTAILDSTYTFNETGTGVDVYVFDTGINIAHSEFGGRADWAYDAWFTGSAQDWDNVFLGHGSHVAGTIGGATFGVAKGVNLHAVRVVNNDSSPSVDMSNLLGGIDWLTQQRWGTPKPTIVANLSLTLLEQGSNYTIEDAISNSAEQGIVYVIAAGNLKKDACTQTPARTPEAITVAASDPGDGWWGQTDDGPCVDIFAPGEQVLSATNILEGPPQTNSLSGTSQAAPHVAGVAAQYLEAHPWASPGEVIGAIVQASTTGALTFPPGYTPGTPNRLLFSLNLQAPPLMTATISGPTVADYGTTETWTANVSGGDPPYRYQWWRSVAGITTRVSSTASYSEYIGDCATRTLRLMVADAEGQFDHAWTWAEIGPPIGPPCGKGGGDP